MKNKNKCQCQPLKLILVNTNLQEIRKSLFKFSCYCCCWRVGSKKEQQNFYNLVFWKEFSVTTGQQLLTSQIDSASDGIVARPSQPVDIAASQPANTNIEESHLANSDEINKTDETTRGKIFQGVKTSPEDQVYCWDPRQKRDKKMRSSHSNNKM
jgi:hypothetical protein